MRKDRFIAFDQGIHFLFGPVLWLIKFLSKILGKYFLIKSDRFAFESKKGLKTDVTFNTRKSSKTRTVSEVDITSLRVHLKRESSTSDELSNDIVVWT